MDRFNTAKEFAEDACASLKCKTILENYNRFEAVVHLQRLTQRYAFEINQLGLFDRVCVIYGVDYSTMSDWQIRKQLVYVWLRSPVYAFLREGDKRIAEALLNSISARLFNA